MFCFLGMTAHVAAACCFMGAVLHGTTAINRTAWSVVDGGDLTVWPLVGLCLLAKNLVGGDVFACGFVVSGSLTVASVAAGGVFVSVTCVATGAGLEADCLSKK